MTDKHLTPEQRAEKVSYCNCIQAAGPCWHRNDIAAEIAAAEEAVARAIVIDADRERAEAFKRGQERMRERLFKAIEARTWLPRKDREFLKTEIRALPLEEE